MWTCWVRNLFQSLILELSLGAPPRGGVPVLLSAVTTVMINPTLEVAEPPVPMSLVLRVRLHLTPAGRANDYEVFRTKTIRTPSRRKEGAMDRGQHGGRYSRVRSCDQSRGSNIRAAGLHLWTARRGLFPKSRFSCSSSEWRALLSVKLSSDFAQWR